MTVTARYLVFFLVLGTLGCTLSQPSERRGERNTETSPTTSQSPPQGNTLENLTAVLDADTPAASEETGQVSQSSPRKKRTMRSPDELLLFFPTKFPDGDWSPKDLEFEDVWFNSSDATRIHGWYCPCKDARAILLYAHGNGGNLSHRSYVLARLQRDTRVAVLIFDYRGYGRSEGSPTVKGILADTRAARGFLAKHADVKESEIVLMGRSLGGAVATQLAAKVQPRGLILESTFSSLKDVAAKHYPALAWLVSAKKLDSKSQITRYHGPLLQSHGDADRVIPYSLGVKLFRAANEPKQLVTIPNADHNDLQSDEYYRQLDQFIGTLPHM